MVDLHLHFWENDVQKPVGLFFSPSPACSKQNSKDICETALGDAVPRKSGDISR